MSSQIVKFDIQTEVCETFKELVQDEELVTAAQAALLAAGLSGQVISLSVEISDDEYVQRLNREYRGVDRTTDVLSFANEEAPDWDGRPGVMYDLRPVADADEVLPDDEPEEAWAGEYDDEADDGPGANETHFVIAPELASSGQRYLGDIVISYPQAERQASEYNNTPQREVQELVVHGVFHLLGYDHEEADEREVMRAREEAAARLLDETAKV